MLPTGSSTTNGSRREVFVNHEQIRDGAEVRQRSVDIQKLEKKVERWKGE